jgi:heterodisulfide reductase subunit B
MNPYLELKNKHQKEINEFPFGFAFNDKQFAEMMEKWGLTPEDTDKIYRIGGGGYIRKADEEAMNEMFERHSQERKAAMEADPCGYCYHMFDYELANHEYNYTGDVTDALDALGLTYEEVKANKGVYDILMKAIKHQESLDW